MPSLSPETAKLLEAIKALPLGETRIMEVCGTHTMSIAKSGIKSLLPAHIKLLSGPGCPVCVTPGPVIDAVLELAMRENVIIASYGKDGKLKWKRDPSTFPTELSEKPTIHGENCGDPMPLPK